jgi:hypothetical protein
MFNIYPNMEGFPELIICNTGEKIAPGTISSNAELL